MNKQIFSSTKQVVMSMIIIIDAFDLFSESCLSHGLDEDFIQFHGFNEDDVHIILDIVFKYRNVIKLDEYAKQRFNNYHFTIPTDVAIDIFRGTADLVDDVFKVEKGRLPNRYLDDWELSKNGRFISIYDRPCQGPSPFVNPFTTSRDR